MFLKFWWNYIFVSCLQQFLIDWANLDQSCRSARSCFQYLKRCTMSTSFQFERNPFCILCSTREMSQSVWTECVNLLKEFKTARPNVQRTSFVTWKKTSPNSWRNVDRRIWWMNLLTLTTSESMSRYTGFKSNNVWNGLKHVRNPEHGECSDPWSELWSDVVLSFRKISRSVHPRHFCFWACTTWVSCSTFFVCRWNHSRLCVAQDFQHCRTVHLMKHWVSSAGHRDTCLSQPHEHNDQYCRERQKFTDFSQLFYLFNFFKELVFLFFSTTLFLFLDLFSTFYIFPFLTLCTLFSQLFHTCTLYDVIQQIYIFCNVSYYFLFFSIFETF